MAQVRSDRRCALRLLILAVGLGVVWRVARYALNLPVTGEEAFLLNNVLHLDYGQLLGPLANAQAAPPVVLWLLRALATATHSDWAVRAPALLAGLATVTLFPLVMRRVVRGLDLWLGFAIFCVSYVPVTVATRAKQYAFELLASLIITGLALWWLKRTSVMDGGGNDAALALRGASAAPPRAQAVSRPPQSIVPMLILALVCPFLFWCSLNSLFMGAGVGLVMLVYLLVHRRSVEVRSWLALALLAGLAALSFAALYLVNLRPALEAQGAVVLRDFWSDAFLPITQPWRIPGWLLSIHAGRMLAYPIGDKNFASILWLVFWIVGIVALAKRHRRWALAILLAPQVVMMLVSATQLYPYGNDPRVNIALAPAICLLIGIGVGRTAARFSPNLRYRLVQGFALFCCVVALGGLSLDVVDRFAGGASTRAVLAQVHRRAGAHDVVVCTQPNAPLAHGSKTQQIFQWYVHTSLSRPMHWDGQMPSPPPAGGYVYLIQFDDSGADAAAAQAQAWGAAQPVELTHLEGWQSVRPYKEPGVVRVDRYRVGAAAADHVCH
ncbi:MAG: hypothetical protein WD042_14060 [Phycisphaeraceae bacterium]